MFAQTFLSTKTDIYVYAQTCPETKYVYILFAMYYTVRQCTVQYSCVQYNIQLVMVCDSDNSENTGSQSVESI